MIKQTTELTVNMNETIFDWLASAGYLSTDNIANYLITLVWYSPMNWPTKGHWYFPAGFNFPLNFLFYRKVH